MGFFLATPFAQTKLATYLTNSLNEKNGVDIRIRRAQITPTGKIILKDFAALDTHKDTIFYGKRLETYVRNIWFVSKTNHLKLGVTRIDNLQGKIIYYKGDHFSNLDDFVKKMEGKPSSGQKPTKAFALDIRKILLTNSHFEYLDYNQKNPIVLDFNYLHADLQGFHTKNDLITADINSLQFLDHSGVQVQDLSTKFTYDNDHINFEKFKLDTDYSSLDMNLNFYSKKGGYSDFQDKIKLTGNIEEAFVSSNDLSKFTSIFNKDRDISISSDISGTLNNLQLSNFESLTDKKIEFDGKLILQNIFDNKTYNIRADLKNLKFSFADLRDFMPKIIDNNIPKELYTLDKLSATGKITYNNTLLKTNINLQTTLGNADINLKINDLNNISKASYTGRIKTNNFKLKHLIGGNIDDLSTDIDLNGKGLTLASIATNVVGRVNAVHFNNYLYHDININANIKNKVFEGLFEIADSNLEMDFTGIVDFSKKKNHINFTSQVCKANLFALGISKKDEISNIEGEISVQADGNTIDDIVGNAKITNLHYTNHIGHYSFKEFSISSQFNNDIRNINFSSIDIADGYIQGRFKFAQIPVLIKNAFGSVFANYKVQEIADNEFIKYKINVHNKIVDLLNPNIKVAKGTYIKGKISSTNNVLKMRFISPKISIKNNDLVNVNLRIDNKNPLYNTFLKVDSINTSFYKIKNFRTLNTTINDTLYLKSKFEGGNKFKDAYNLSFYYTMDEMQNFIFGLQNSSLLYKNIPWKIAQNKNRNKIFYNTVNDSLNLQNIGIFNDSEQLSVSGFSTAYKLNYDVSIDSLDLGHIAPDITEFQFDGLLNGNLNLKQIGEDILPTAQLRINHFKVNDKVLGDLNLKINTLKGKNVFVDMKVVKNNLQVMKANGFVDMNKKNPFINGSILLQEFPASIMQNIFKDMFSDIRGNMTGNVQVKGNMDDLSYDGKLYLNGFGLNVDVLNVDYQFDNRTVLYLHDQTFELKKAVFDDVKYKSKAEISGVIKHHNFDKWYLDLNIVTKNLLVLDTPVNPDEPYYGIAFVGGKTRIHGYTNRLIIDADMQTKTKTNFVITLNDTETIGDNDFVNIISKNAYQKEKSSKKDRNKIYEGLEMNFDLDITPDAIVKILLDQEFGSMLSAKGVGGMLLEINTNGRFNMWGDFTVLKGVYNLKYYGLIDKKFAVEPGSIISWEGNPYDANLDIKAMYELVADPTILLLNQGVSSKKMPVEVIIYLKDKLLHPTITYDLDLPKANAILKSQIDYQLSDNDKKTLQVLSLLSFGSFMNEEDYNLGKNVGDGAVKTISETGLNLLNALMTQDEKFQVNLNYTGGENDVNNNVYTDPQVGLTLSTKINKRVYINGKVAIPVGRFTKSSIVGDVEMEVYLDKTGNLIFRVFNKQTELEYIGQQEGYTQGVGISYQVDFDTFKEILQKIGVSLSKTP